jgi:flagellar biosynthesis component FlhA
MLSVAAGMVVAMDFDTAVPPDLLSLEIGHSLIPLVNDDQGSGLIKQIQLLKDSLKPGIIVPRIRIIDNLRLKLTEYCLKIKGVEAGRGELEMKGRTTAELCLVIANHIGEIIKEHDEELSKEDDEQCP